MRDVSTIGAKIITQLLRNFSFGVVLWLLRRVKIFRKRICGVLLSVHLSSAMLPALEAVLVRNVNLRIGDHLHFST